jgi:hypothetical protein
MGDEALPPELVQWIDALGLKGPEEIANFLQVQRGLLNKMEQ